MKTNNLKCICCGTNVQLLDLGCESDSPPEHGMWEDGMVDKVTAGYGSKFDCDRFLIAMCDSCIEEKVKDDTLVFLYNLDYPDETKGARHGCCD